MRKLRPDLDDPALLEQYLCGESAAQLAREYKANIWSVLSRIRAAGIRVRSNKEQNEKRLNLTQSQRRLFLALVDGILLGDGSIDPKGCLRLEQANRRRGWLDQVVGLLSELEADSRLIKIPPRTRTLEGRVVRSGGGCLLYMPCYVELQEQRKRWYPRGVKRVPKDVDLSPCSLAHWFAGDGTYDTSGSLFLCTDGFLKKEVVRLAHELSALGVRATCISGRRPSQFKVAILRRDDAQLFKDVIAEYLPACCFYKLRYVRPRLTYEARSRAHRKYSDTTERKVVAARSRGLSLSALAFKFGIRQSTVQNIVRRFQNQKGST